MNEIVDLILPETIQASDYNQEYWQSVARINNLFVTNDIRFEFYEESLHFIYKDNIFGRQFMYDEVEIIKETYKYLQKLKQSEG